MVQATENCRAVSLPKFAWQIKLIKLSFDQIYKLCTISVYHQLPYISSLSESYRNYNNSIYPFSLLMLLS